MSDVLDHSPLRGWILYDAECPFCTNAARHFERIFRHRGFRFLPLQTSWVMKRLGLDPQAPLEEMRVLTPGGEDFGGADAILFLAQQIWWAWPLFALGQIPGAQAVLRRAYRWVATRRGCNHNACQMPSQRKWPAGIPLLLLPALAFLTRNRIPPWVFMWIMCTAIFLGCKWLTFWPARRRGPISAKRAFCYFLAWPGMDADKFFRPVRRAKFPAVASILFASAKALFGAFLFFVVARQAHASLLTGWIGMIGLIFLLHFGLFHLLAIAGRAVGLEVNPIMKSPWRATSLSEFWSRRWNGAFNQLALDHVFRPVSRSFGVTVATLAAFLVSGLIHELVISLPAGAGYGLPTAYFLFQGCGILAERAERKIRGHTFTLLVAALPAFWLFHPPFVRVVILPFMKAVGAL